MEQVGLGFALLGLGLHKVFFLTVSNVVHSPQVTGGVPRPTIPPVATAPTIPPPKRSVSRSVSLCAARSNRGWRRVLVERKSEGVEVTEMGGEWGSSGGVGEPGEGFGGKQREWWGRDCRGGWGLSEKSPFPLVLFSFFVLNTYIINSLIQISKFN